MNKVIGGFEDVIEQGGQAVVQGAKKQAADFGKSLKGQVVGKTPTNDQGTNEQASAAKKQMNDDQAQQFLKDLYGPTKKEPESHGNEAPLEANPVDSALGLKQDDPNEGKTPEEIAKIASLRNQLHGDYYQNLVNRPQNKNERVAEKVEREDEEEKMKLYEKEKEKPSKLPATVKQGTGEKMVGVAG